MLLVSKTAQWTCVAILLTSAMLSGCSKFFSQQQALELPLEVTQEEKIDSADTSEFVEYLSPIGFRVNYPRGWEVREVEGIDASLGGVHFFPKGTVLLEHPIWNKDVSEQLISIGGSVSLKTYAETWKSLENEEEASKLVLQDTRESSILKSEKITINSELATTIDYLDAERDVRGKAAVLLAMPADDPELSPAIILTIDYKAKESLYSPDIAEEVMRSFRGL